MISMLLLGCVAGIIVVVLILRKFSFSGQRPEQYAFTQPVFDLRAHLDGQMICDGVIYGPLGAVTSRFKADFDITWEGDTARMCEHFVYDDGSEQRRTWLLERDVTNRFTARAEDVVGEGQGVMSGATVQLLYKIRLPESAGGHILDAVDWMMLGPDGAIVNRSQFRKFGFKVAELVATIRRKEAI